MASYLPYVQSIVHTHITIGFLGEMADGSGCSEAGAALLESNVILQLRRLQQRKSRNEWKYKSALYFWHVIIITSYIAVLMIMSVRPCWSGATMQVLGKANTPTKHVCLTFHWSGQYGAYHDFLNNGKAHYAPQRISSYKNRNIKGY